MIDLFNDLSFFDIVFAVCLIVRIILSFFEGKSLSKIKKEVKDMIYRLPSYKEDEKEVKGQTFDTTVPVYQFNEKTGQVDEVDREDIVEKIQSVCPSPLQSIIDTLNPSPDTDVVSGAHMTPIDAISELRETAYDLMDDIDPDFVGDFKGLIDLISQKYTEVKSKVNAAMFKKGGEESAKKNEESSVSGEKQNVQQDSSTGTSS